MTQSGNRPGRVVVLSGGSSAGKTTLGRKLQSSLDGTWLLIGVDVLLWTLPIELFHSADGLSVRDGVISRGDRFMSVFAAFRQSVATLARAGADVLIDDVMLEAPADQLRWQESLGDLAVLWIGVKCAPDVAEAREKARGDRAWGVARQHALTVHEGVRYDLEIDTDRLETAASVDLIAALVRRRWSVSTTPATDEPPAYRVTSALSPDGGRAPAPWES